MGRGFETWGSDEVPSRADCAAPVATTESLDSPSPSNYTDNIAPSEPCPANPMPLSSASSPEASPGSTSDPVSFGIAPGRQPSPTTPRPELRKGKEKMAHDKKKPPTPKSGEEGEPLDEKILDPRRPGMIKIPNSIRNRP
jgi:hypothetical protein